MTSYQNPNLESTRPSYACVVPGRCFIVRADSDIPYFKFPRRQLQGERGRGLSGARALAAPRRAPPPVLRERESLIEPTRFTIFEKITRRWVGPSSSASRRGRDVCQESRRPLRRAAAFPSSPPRLQSTCSPARGRLLSEAEAPSRPTPDYKRRATTKKTQAKA